MSEAGDVIRKGLTAAFWMGVWIGISGAAVSVVIFWAFSQLLW